VTEVNSKIYFVIRLTILFTAIGGANISAAQERVQTDVVYGVLSGLSLTMDVHQPEESNRRGVVLVVGSGWDGRESGFTEYQLKNGNPYINELRDAIVQAGFTVFVPNHRAAPQHRYPAAVEDILRAVRFVRFNASQFGIEPYPLGGVGHSSGGHLVGMAGVRDDNIELQESPYPVERESSRLQAVVTIASPHDLSVPDGISWPYVVTFMGEAPPMDATFTETELRGKYAEASPVTHVTPDDASFLMLHGEGDSYVMYEQLSIMGSALAQAGVSADAVSIDSDSHVPPLDHAAIIAWLEGQLL
jgi:acetyl esterase/lipase